MIGHMVYSSSKCFIMLRYASWYRYITFFVLLKASFKYLKYVGVKDS